MMPSFIFLTVVYNKKYDDCETVKSFFNALKNFGVNDVANDVELHIWDNSTDSDTSEYNLKCSALERINYHSSGNNENLSFVYNKFIDSYPNSNLIILDDDSNVSELYIEQVLKLKNDSFYVAVPKLFSQIGNMYSPAKYGLVKGQHLKDISSGFHLGLVAITSGLVINCKKIIEEELFFDENLNLYGIDTDFFLRVSYKNINIYVLDVCIQHDLSYYNKEKAIVKRNRFLNLMGSNFYIAKKRSTFHALCYALYMPLVFLKNLGLFIRR